jgi:hypothetical protein
LRPAATLRCLNPQMKKACIVNRERIAQGLKPLLPGSG